MLLILLSSGPNTASIENADRVVATASKLVLGVYKFQLTVADAEKMESSSTITVSVKQSKSRLGLEVKLKVDVIQMARLF